MSVYKKVWLRAKSNEDAAEFSRSVFAQQFKNVGLEVVDQIEPDIDLCVVLSGDGTLLSSIRRLEDMRKTTPVLGLHASQGLGFLHPFSLKNKEKQDIDYWAKAFARCIVDGAFTCVKRSGLIAKLFNKQNENFESFWALNDIVFSKGALSRMIRFNLYVDGKELYTKARGDGLIISSSTGSTAYSLSAGGPIVHPDIDALLITPVCLHQMNQKSVILPPSSKLKIDIIPSSSSFFVTADGQEGCDFSEGSYVEIIQDTDGVTQLIPQIEGVEVKNYYKNLKEKLGFGGVL